MPGHMQLIKAVENKCSGSGDVVFRFTKTALSFLKLPSPKLISGIIQIKTLRSNKKKDTEQERYRLHNMDDQPLYEDWNTQTGYSQ